MAHREAQEILDPSDRVRDRIVTDARIDLLAEAIDAGLTGHPRKCERCGEMGQRTKPSPTWGRIFRDIAEGVGRKLEVDVELVHRLGMPIAQAQVATRAWQQVEWIDDDGAAELALGWLREYHRARGEEVRIVRVAEIEAGDGSALPESELP